MKRREVTSTAVVYDGNCPMCGAAQTSSISTSVDRECYDCECKREHLELIERNRHVIGARIVELRGDREQIQSIVIETDTGTRFEIVATDVEYTTPDLEINEIVEMKA